MKREKTEREQPPNGGAGTHREAHPTVFPQKRLNAGIWPHTRPAKRCDTKETQQRNLVHIANVRHVTSIKSF